MQTLPSALLLISSHCPHCPSMLQSLSELIKEGKLSSLEIINIETAPERADALKVRSVPWVKLGEFELVGLKSKNELLEWIDKTAAASDMVDYFTELMTSGELSKVQLLVEGNPEYMQSLFNIMQDSTSSLSARIGVAATIEQLSGSQLLIDHINDLGKYCQHANARVRNDACYYLGLSLHKDAISYITPLLTDVDKDTRETAKDALDDIKGASKNSVTPYI